MKAIQIILTFKSGHVTRSPIQYPEGRLHWNLIPALEEEKDYLIALDVFATNFPEESI